MINLFAGIVLMIVIMTVMGLVFAYYCSKPITLQRSSIVAAEIRDVARERSVLARERAALARERAALDEYVAMIDDREEVQHIGVTVAEPVRSGRFDYLEL